MGYEPCKNCGHEIIKVKKEWYHRTNEARAKVCFYCPCEKAEPIDKTLNFNPTDQRN